MRSEGARLVGAVVEGIEAMPKALVGLFRGENFGKLIVKVGHEPN